MDPLVLEPGGLAHHLTSRVNVCTDHKNNGQCVGHLAQSFCWRCWMSWAVGFGLGEQSSERPSQVHIEAADYVQQCYEDPAHDFVWILAH